MQKGVFFETDVHKSRLETVLKVSNLSLVDAPDHPQIVDTLDGQVLELALDGHRHPRLERLSIDEHLLVAVLDGAEHTLDLADELFCAALHLLLDGSGRFFRQFHRGKLSLMLAVLLWRFLLCRVFAVHRLVGELPLRLGRLEVGIGQQSVRLVLGAHNLTMVLPCIVNLVLCGLYGFNIRTGLEAGAIRSAVSAARGLE